jgi:N-methylhydantoinase B/oxoprolinase/acetone carboxylase alpha subunit
MAVHAGLKQQIKERNKMLLNITNDNHRLVDAIHRKDSEMQFRSNTIGDLRTEIGRLNTILERIREEHDQCGAYQIENHELRFSLKEAQERAETSTNKALRLSAQMRAHTHKQQQMGEEVLYLRAALRTEMRSKQGAEYGVSTTPCRTPLSAPLFTRFSSTCNTIAHICPTPAQTLTHTHTLLNRTRS